MHILEACRLSREDRIRQRHPLLIPPPGPVHPGSTLPTYPLPTSPTLVPFGRILTSAGGLSFGSSTSVAAYMRVITYTLYTACLQQLMLGLALYRIALSTSFIEPLNQIQFSSITENLGLTCLGGGQPFTSSYSSTLCKYRGLGPALMYCRVCLRFHGSLATLYTLIGLCCPW